jgi:hypothetical protein
VIAVLLACRGELVELTKNPNLANEVTATLRDVESGALVSCEGDTTAGDPWPERHVFPVDPGGSVTMDGLLAATEYRCVVEGADSRFELTTDPLPEALDFTTLVTTALDPDGVVLGFTLLNATDTVGDPSAAIVVDFLGRVRWYASVSGYDGLGVFEYDPLRGDFYGGGGFFDPMPLHVWDRSATPDVFPDVVPDHEVERFGEHYYHIVYEGTDDTTGTGRRHCIEERDARGASLWTWCSSQALEVGIGAANSIALEDADGETWIYATIAGLGHIYKLERSTGEVAWVYGADRDFAGDVAYPRWMHDLQVAPCDGFDRCLLFYDNGDEASGVPSSIQKVGLDETAMTAETLRSWTEAGWSEPRLGGIQELGTSWLIGSGRGQGSTSGRPSQVVEVDGAGEVVWRLELEPETVSLYRARRVEACALFHHAGMCPTLE